MSIVFKPKINFSFGSSKAGPVTKNVPREKWHWSTKELKRVVSLRAIGVSYKDCAKLIDRSQGAIVAAVDTNNLYSAIAKEKEGLIITIMKDYNND
jgi:hypothetical protein